MTRIRLLVAGLAALAVAAFSALAAAQTSPVEPSFPSALINYQRSCVKDSFGTGPGRMPAAQVEQVFDNVFPNGDRTLSGNGEGQLYGPAGDWSSYADRSDHAELVASPMPGRTITGTTSYNAADAGAIKSAMLSTKATYRYGYFEIRAQVPPVAAKGSWFAFWMTRGNAPPTAWWPPEPADLEVVNNSGSATADDGPGNPFYGIPNQPAVYRTLLDRTNPWKSFHPGVDLSLDYHVYAFEWLSGQDGNDRYRRYLDGVLVSDYLAPWVYADGRAAGGAHIYINLAYGGGWAGRNGINAAALPTSAKLDYFMACSP